MTTRAQNKEVTAFVLGAFGIEDQSASKIIDDLKLDRIAVLRELSADELRDLRVDEEVPMGDVVAIKTLQNWLKNSGLLPTTLDEWKTILTEESILQYGTNVVQTQQEITGGVAHHGAIADPSSSRTEPSGDMTVKFSDYPDFTGKHSDWYAYKAMHTSTAKVHGYADLLNPANIDEHLRKRTDEPAYDRKVRVMHAILYKKTAKGTAFSKVKAFEATEDGVLAWKALKDYYDQEGNKSLYGTNRLNELMNLKLKYTSYGGFDKYQNNFDVLCNQLEECGHGLPDDQKRTIFLRNIEDQDYSTIIELCWTETYTNVIQKLRNKAAMIGKQSGPCAEIKIK